MTSRLHRLLFVLLLLPALAQAQDLGGGAPGTGSSAAPASAAPAPVAPVQMPVIPAPVITNQPAAVPAGRPAAPVQGSPPGQAAAGARPGATSTAPGTATPGAPAPTGVPAAAPAQPGAQPDTQAQPPAQPLAPAFVDVNERNQFQDFVAQSTGLRLPLFGYNLFQGAPSTFAPVDRIPVTSDYVIGPGDAIVIRAWGQIDVDYTATVDRNGQIAIPKVGTLSVAGLRFQDLHGFLKTAIGRIFRNFELNVTMGELRSIQVFVVGQAARPGVYTVSSLSTLVNALFASGGPSPKGSMRRIQLKRGDQTVAEFDMYDLLVNGDKSKDARLLPGDVIYIPPAGRLAALSGSVNTQAIFELKGTTTFEELIKLAGGFTTTAQGQKAIVDRIVERTVRRVDEFALDKAGLARTLQDGDVITVASITPRFDNAVRLQGNVAAAMRYPWRQGMRVTDLLTDQNALITTAYWQRQNSGGLYANYNRREVNFDYATIQRLDRKDLVTHLVAFNLGKAIGGDARENAMLQPGDIVTIYSFEDALPKTEHHVLLQGSVIGGTPRRFAWREGMRVRDIIPSAQWLIDYYNYWLHTAGVSDNSEINWRYASVVRLHPADLTRDLLTLELGKAVIEGDAQANLALRPGDEITIFSKSEIQVPTDETKVFVRVEGEVNRAGVYQARRGETLRELVIRIGGIGPKAYLFGAVFTRESTRVAQQKNLDEAIARLEVDAQQSLAVAAQNVSTGDAETIKQQAVAQQAVIARLRQLKASGRIILKRTADAQMRDIPDLALENGDRLSLPVRPAIVSVLGSVYSPGSFMYEAGQSVSDYLAQSGGPIRTADAGATYVLKADGSVVSRRQSWGGFSFENVMPGDTIVVPEDFDRTTWTKTIKDWTQILYQFGLGAAAIHILGK